MYFKTINSFERVKKAIHFDYPDRIPIMHAILPGAWLKYRDRLYEIVKKFPSDFVHKNLKLSSKRSSAGFFIIFFY